MNFVHANSQECSKSELDLFSIPPTQVSLEKGHWVDLQPISSVADGGAIVFTYPGTENYVDLSKTILVVQAKVTKADGTDLDDDEKVGVINNFLHSLFKQVDVFLKGKQVSQASGLYGYRAYLETLLNYAPSAKKSQLTAALFYKDTAGKMEVADPTVAAANANHGLKTRYEFSKTSGILEMAGPIFSDVFFTERLLLSFVDLKVIMSRNSDQFCLMASEDGANYKVKLIDAKLKVRVVKVNPSVSMAHEIALKKGPALYPIRRVVCKSFIIPSGNPSVIKDNIFNGLVPRSFVFGMVDSTAAITGEFKKNPFNFQHFNVSSIGITVNGEEIPFKTIPLSYGANGQFVEAFITQFSGTGKLFHNLGNGIGRNEFPNGYAIYCFDLTPDLCSASPHFNAIQRGTLGVDITFSAAPRAPVSLICYGEFENLIQIDAERNVVYDYSG